MSLHPRITLITTVRNGAAFIERCLTSVTQQNYPNLEYIVLDAASTDGTQEIIGRYLPHISFYRSERDKGPNDAIMKGYRMATGDIIGLLMADDWLEPDALATLAEMYTADPEAQMFCFGMQEYRKGSSGALEKTKFFCDPPGKTFTLLDGLYCQGVNRYYSRSLIATDGVYRDEIYPNLADRDYYVRLGIKHVRKAWTDKILYNFLTHPGSNSTGGSAQKVVKFLDETARMADDYLHMPDMGDEDKALLKDWYCFNVLRSVWFRLKAGMPVAAMLRAAAMALRYPLRSLKCAIFWKMPEAYRARYNA